MSKRSKIWDWISDTPEQYEEAIKNAVSENERIFYETMYYKVQHETANSHEILMMYDENDEEIYILRVGMDEIMVGHNKTVPGRNFDEIELAGVCFAMTYDLYELLGYHITLREWLRKRDYKGIRYDRNNDCL